MRFKVAQDHIYWRCPNGQSPCNGEVLTTEICCREKGVDNVDGLIDICKEYSEKEKNKFKSACIEKQCCKKDKYYFLVEFEFELVSKTTRAIKNLTLQRIEKKGCTVPVRHNWNSSNIIVYKKADMDTRVEHLPVCIKASDGNQSINKLYFGFRLEQELEAESVYVFYFTMGIDDVEHIEHKLRFTYLGGDTIRDASVERVENVGTVYYANSIAAIALYLVYSVVETKLGNSVFGGGLSSLALSCLGGVVAYVLAGYPAAYFIKKVCNTRKSENDDYPELNFQGKALRLFGSVRMLCVQCVIIITMLLLMVLLFPEKFPQLDYVVRYKYDVYKKQNIVAIKNGYFQLSAYEKYTLKSGRVLVARLSLVENTGGAIPIPYYDKPYWESVVYEVSVNGTAKYTVVFDITSGVFVQKDGRTFKYSDQLAAYARGENKCGAYSVSLDENRFTLSSGKELTSEILASETELMLAFFSVDACKIAAEEFYGSKSDAYSNVIVSDVVERFESYGKMSSADFFEYFKTATGTSFYSDDGTETSRQRMYLIYIVLNIMSDKMAFTDYADSFVSIFEKKVCQAELQNRDNNVFDDPRYENVYMKFDQILLQWYMNIINFVLSKEEKCIEDFEKSWSKAGAELYAMYIQSLYWHGALTNNALHRFERNGWLYTISKSTKAKKWIQSISTACWSEAERESLESQKVLEQLQLRLAAN